MRVDTVIVNGKLVTSQEVLDDVVVEISGEKIAYVGHRSQAFEAKKTIDARGKYILPGIIDPHVHYHIKLGEARPWESELITETKAAAAGGITTSFEFIIEQGSVADLLPSLAESTSRCATIDMGFHAVCMTEKHLEELPRCRKAGIKGFKFFMAYKGNELESFGISGIDVPYVYRGMEIIKDLGGVAQVHAENYDLLKLYGPRYANQNSFHAFNLSRPPICTEVDAFIACRIAEKTGCPLYIVHLGAGNVIDIAERFRARKTEIYLETCPRYLLIDEVGTGLKRPVLALTTPGYYPRQDLDRMWEALGAGKVDSIGTDSGTFTLKDKMSAKDVWTMPIGWQEMPTSLPTMLSEGVNKKRITLPQLVATMSYNPARIFGIYPQKGNIAPGADADIVLVDLNMKRKVKAELFPSSCDFTPYEDWELQGWPVLTMVRGKVVMESGKVAEASGWGRPVNLKV